MVFMLFVQSPLPHGIFYFILTVLMVDTTSSATVAQNGRISPCKAPCTEYGIVATARLERIDLKIYKVVRRAEDEIAKASDVRQVVASPGQWQINITAILYEPQTFDPILKALVESAKKVIPVNNRFSTPFFFLVLQSEKGVYGEALNAMSLRVIGFLNNLNNHPFLPPSKRSIAIIHERSEILFKWLTVNFLAGYFDQEKSHSKVGVLGLSLNTVTQIAYPVHSTSMNTTEFVTIGTMPYLLIAQSYTTEGFGTTLREYFTKLGQVQGQGKQTSPCSPQGAQVQVVDGDIVKQYIGNGNVQQCLKILNDVILNDYGRWTRSPYIRKPPKYIKFYALPQVVNVLNEIGCLGCEKVFTPAKINAAARLSCSSSQPRNGDLPSTKNCLNANFFYLMLTESYHFEDNTPITVLPKSVHGIDEDWALGALLYKLRLLSYKIVP
ncbi:uncharacterized protein LOC116302627 [Actinia tenebrosa]|uniref:Uncharacterized protein LOC116302627 n=1 Tax=Actinia tenebrosa TaxID=6105 RepID=A0A6P8IMP1_ACTTE|nr:uncharacterized protein LOC116302627 [Actinia tenebrosa]